jgi:hypothetical protein
VVDVDVGGRGPSRLAVGALPATGGGRAGRADDHAGAITSGARRTSDVVGSWDPPESLRRTVEEDLGATPVGVPDAEIDIYRTLWRWAGEQVTVRFSEQRGLSSVGRHARRGERGIELTERPVWLGPALHT